MHIDTRKAYDAIANKYDSHFMSNLDIAENKVIRNILRKYITSTSRVLDVGCGTGLLLDYMNIDPLLYHGTDISEGMIDEAHRKHPDYLFTLEPMENMRYNVNTMDVITSLFGSFSYTTNPFSTLHNMRRILRASGTLILMTFSPRYPDKKDVMERNNFKVPFYTWTQRYINRIVGKYFDVQDSFGFSCIPNHIKYTLPEFILKPYLRLESMVLGRYFPDQCMFHITIGSTKNDYHK